MIMENIYVVLIVGLSAAILNRVNSADVTGEYIRRS